jgi:hypothetical protein
LSGGAAATAHAAHHPERSLPFPLEQGQDRVQGLLELQVCEDVRGRLRLALRVELEPELCGNVLGGADEQDFARLFDLR